MPPIYTESFRHGIVLRVAKWNSGETMRKLKRYLVCTNQIDKQHSGQKVTDIVKRVKTVWPISVFLGSSYRDGGHTSMCPRKNQLLQIFCPWPLEDGTQVRPKPSRVWGLCWDTLFQKLTLLESLNRSAVCRIHVGERLLPSSGVMFSNVGHIYVFLKRHLLHFKNEM